MKINKLRLQEKFETKLYYEDNPIPQIGKTLKMKRKELNLTLNEASQMIDASISYISKIENDQMKPNFDKIRLLLDTLHIDEELILYSTDMEKWYVDLLDYLIDVNSDCKELLKLTEYREDFQGKLIQFALEVKSGDISGCETYLTLLYNSIEQMSQLELGIFMLATAYFHFKKEDYLATADIIELLHSKQYNNEKFTIWFEELKYQMACMIGSEQNIKTLFSKLSYKYLIYNFESRLSLIKESYICTIPYYDKPLMAENMYQMNINQVTYNAYLISKYIQSKYQEILESTRNSEQHLITLLCKDMLYNTIDSQAALLKIEPLSGIESYLLTYLRVKYLDDKVYDYLRHHMFNDPNVYHSKFLLSFFYNKMTNIYKKLHRYKECVTLQDYYYQRLSEINTIERKLEKNS